MRSFAPEVVLELQPLIEARCRANLGDRTDYQTAPVPLLGQADAEWASGLLHERKLR